MNPGDEIVLIVDEENRPVGAAPRRMMRRNRLHHRSVYILVFNSSGELFLQKRTMSKDVYPGYFDPAAGGVVLEGESCEDAAQRELEEELGIRGVPLEPLFDFYFAEGRVWGRAFRCTYDGELRLQEEEIESGCFLAPEEILRRELSEPLTPDGMLVVKRYLERTAHCHPPKSTDL